MKVVAWSVFTWSLLGSFAVFLTAMAAALVLRVGGGDLSTAEANLFLGLLYWGAYPLVFVALGALGVHLVGWYTGRYAA